MDSQIILEVSLIFRKLVSSIQLFLVCW